MIKDKKIAAVILGCRTNQYEGDALCSMLKARGAVLLSPFEPSSGHDTAIIVLGCTITAAADKKTRQAIRKMRRLHPGAKIYASGCFDISTTLDDIKKLGADGLIGNGFKSKIIDVIENDLSDVIIKNNAHDGWDALFMTSPVLHSRAFIKIQEGCTCGCAYCVVPQVRGASISRPHCDIMREIKSVAQSGCPEIILTGINLGLYGKDNGHSLAGLIKNIAKTATFIGLKRLRFGSLEPFAVTESLLQALSDTDIFCPHLHLPMQSGDDGVLADMKRGYSAADYARTVENCRKFFPDIHISTDVLVGFPSETDEAFANTLKIIEAHSIAKLHVFGYSARKGTQAATMPQATRHETIKARTLCAINLGERLFMSYAKNFVSKEVNILIEEEKGGAAAGLTEHFIRAQVSLNQEENKSHILKIINTIPKEVKILSEAGIKNPLLVG